MLRASRLARHIFAPAKRRERSVKEQHRTCRIPQQLERNGAIQIAPRAVVDIRNGSIVATLDTGEGTDGAAFDPELGFAFASNGRDGTLTVVKATNGKYEVAGQVATQLGARTVAVDPKSHRVFLPTAELGPPAEGQRWPSVKPGSFTVLVFEPVK